MTYVTSPRSAMRRAPCRCGKCSGYASARMLVIKLVIHYCTLTVQSRESLATRCRHLNRSSHASARALVTSSSLTASPLRSDCMSHSQHLVARQASYAVVLAQGRHSIRARVESSTQSHTPPSPAALATSSSLRTTFACLGTSPSVCIRWSALALNSAVCYPQTRGTG